MDDENVCEHGDHPAPPGKRFCSPDCQACEGAESPDDTGCAGLCSAWRCVVYGDISYRFHSNGKWSMELCDTHEAAFEKRNLKARGRFVAKYARQRVEAI